MNTLYLLSYEVQSRRAGGCVRLIRSSTSWKPFRGRSF